MILTRRLPGLIYTYRYTVYSIFILFSCFVYFLFKWNLLCTNLQAWHHINRMCKFYKDYRAVGSLCAPLCSNQDIHSINCHSFGNSKEVVFSAEWHNTKLIFKAASTINIQSIHWYENGRVRYPTEKQFLSSIRAIVRNKLNITLPHDSLVRLGRLKPAYEEKDIAKRRHEIDNLWILLQDNEYFLSAIYAEKDVFPQLLGTCGSYFAVEYVEEIKDVSTLLSISDNREDWALRLRLALQILELLDELDVNFKESFHLCNVKLQDFGMAKSGNRLKFIDVDGVYSKALVARILNETDKCERDDDCEFYDCRAKCSKTRGKCLGAISNSNLQIVCEKIFLGWRLSNTVLVPGLLMSQHTPAELASVLRQCANPESEEGKPRAAPEDEIKTRLVNILSEIENVVANEMFL